MYWKYDEQEIAELEQLFGITLTHDERETYQMLDEVYQMTEEN